MTVLYNELEPYAAAWLGNLINAGHIARGTVDARSIRDLAAADVVAATQFHAFAGIGVWSYALRLAGWPDDRPAWTGSCPCQPFSDAGDGLGFDDPRHLWPVWFNLIRECRPPVVLGEQVASRAGLAWLDLVRADLEAEGYAVGAADLCAAGVGAPHIRQRLFFGAVRVGDADGGRAGWDRGAAPRAEAPRGGGGVLPRGVGDATHVPGAAGALADSIGARLEGLAGHGDHRHEPGRLHPLPARPAAARGAAGVVARADGELDDGAGRGPRGLAQPADGRGPRAFAAPWADCAWVPCRDGKARPVEPGTFPLAHGAPARVGRLRAGGSGQEKETLIQMSRTGMLRAYGNAIVPQVAAAFVRAFVDSFEEMQHLRHREGAA